MIQCTKEYLNTEKNISTIVEKAKKVLRQRKALYNRYTRKVDSSDIKIPLEYYITNIASGFFGGKAPEYTIKQEQNEQNKSIIKKLFDKIVGSNANKEEFKMLIDYIRDYNDDPLFFYELVKDYFITRACYGLLYETTDNEIVYSRVPSTQTVAIYDYSTPVQKIGLLRIWQETDDGGFEVDKVELITNENKRYYKNSKLQPKEYKEIANEKEDVDWLLVPCIAIENADDLGIFEPVLTLIDAYEQVIKNNKNTFQYNDEAKLMVTGYSPQEPLMIKDENDKAIPNPARIAEDEKILNAKVFYTPDAEGQISWIIKDINDTASENHKKTLMELILMTTCIPNVTDVGFTNADNASALEKKFFPLEQVLIQADKQFKKELLSMWENIVDRINYKKATNFDFREIQIDLKRNMPTEKKEIVEMAMKLRGLLSDETVIGMLPFELDTETEIAKAEEQTEDKTIESLNKIINGKKDIKKQEKIKKQEDKIEK